MGKRERKKERDIEECWSTQCYAEGEQDAGDGDSLFFSCQSKRDTWTVSVSLAREQTHYRRWRKQKQRKEVSTINFNFCVYFFASQFERRWAVKNENDFLPWDQTPGACGYALHLHWDSNRCCLCVWQRAGGAGGVCEQGSPWHHLLLHCVSSGGWHLCGAAGHPSGDCHQSGIKHSVLYLPFPIMSAADHYPKLHPFSSCYCHRSIPASQDSYQVSNLAKNIYNFDLCFYGANKLRG